MQNDKLLPCPFCGKKPNICDNVNLKNPVINNKTIYAVRCSDGCFARTNEYKTEEDAIKAWNTRKPMERIVEQLENKVKELEDISSQCELTDKQKAQNYGYAVAINHAIEIVRNGGKE